MKTSTLNLKRAIKARDERNFYTRHNDTARAGVRHTHMTIYAAAYAKAKRSGK